MATGRRAKTKEKTLLVKFQDLALLLDTSRQAALCHDVEKVYSTAVDLTLTAGAILVLAHELAVLTTHQPMAS